MGLFDRRSKSASKNAEDKKLIEENSNKIEVLIEIAEDEGIKNDLRKIKEKIKYLIPSENEKVIRFDQKIRDMIAETKLIFSRYEKKDNTSEITSQIKELNILIAERNGGL